MLSLEQREQLRISFAQLLQVLLCPSDECIQELAHSCDPQNSPRLRSHLDFEIEFEYANKMLFETHQGYLGGFLLPMFTFRLPRPFRIAI